MARKRRFSTFSLSFLDIMSCGFGAVALIFLIIKHDVDNQTESLHPELQAEVSLLEEEILDGEANLVRAKNTVSEVDQRIAEAQGLARIINEDLNTVQAAIKNTDDPNLDITALKQKLEELESEKQKLEQDNQELGNKARRFVGQGNRQYLTGLNLGGAHVLILLDSSASMLDETIVNIVRRRNMDKQAKIASQKWQRALGTVEWLTAQLPEAANYQIFNFNSQAKPAISGSERTWLKVSDKAQLERVVDNLRQLTPENGTNLYQSLTALAGLDPIPDNIFIITDGLPTLGRKAPKKNTITGPDRLKLFNEAVDLFPKGVPVNTILLPLEGDVMAAPAYWQLAQLTQGAFLTPSKDWP
ncbi:hypothetical protein [Halioxenophilus aromaticivorans]|uniref:VWA domain-containing protein n=1 Tax=Halioxenophilus aromaticivorans TaxID=1306992 RepID=A0AAV3U607_9ALTE